MDKKQSDTDKLKKNISEAENFDELIAAVKQCEGVMEDNVFLTSNYLIKRVEYLRKYQDPNGLFLIPEMLGLREKAQELFRKGEDQPNKTEVKDMPLNSQKRNEAILSGENKKVTDVSKRGGVLKSILNIIPKKIMSKSKEPIKNTDAEIADIWSENENGKKGDVSETKIAEKKISKTNNPESCSHEIEKNIVALELEKSILVLEDEADDLRDKLKDQEDSILDIKKILEDASWESPELIQVEAEIEKTKSEISAKEDEIAGLRDKLEAILK